MPGVSKIYHKGKEILFIDYKGTANDLEMIAILKETQKIIISDNKEYLQLVDISNAFATPLYMQAAKQVAKETPKLAKKRALVGITSSSRKILLMGYNLLLGKNGLRPFDTLEEAKNWLVE
jgi:hypothetical protein